MSFTNRTFAGVVDAETPSGQIPASMPVTAESPYLEPAIVVFDQGMLPPEPPGDPDKPRSLAVTVLFNLALTIVGLVAAGLVPFGFNLAVGRTYGPAELGTVSVALGLGLFLGQIPGTISSAATKFIAESLGGGDELRARRVFQFLLVVISSLSLALAIVFLAFTPVLQSVYGLSFPMIVMAAALIPTYTLYLYFKSCYYGFARVRTYLVNEIVSDACFFGVLAAVFVLGATPWLLLPFVLNNLIFSLIGLWNLAPYLHDFTWMEKAARRSVLRYCLIFGSGSAASLGRWFLGTAIAAIFLTHQSVGLFAAAIAITAPLPLLPRAISLVTFALMSRLHGAGESASIRMVLQQSTEWLGFVLGVPSGLAIINAALILSLVFRPEYAQAAIATQLIVAGAYITDVSRPSIDALSSTTYVRIATVASFLGLFVSLTVWLVLIPIGGITMAGLGFALGAAVTAMVPAYYAYRYIGTAPAVFIRPAVMLVSLGVFAAVGPRYALVTSVIFVVGTCVLYRHLIDMMLRFGTRELMRRTKLSEGTA